MITTHQPQPSATSSPSSAPSSSSSQQQQQQQQHPAANNINNPPITTTPTPTTTTTPQPQQQQGTNRPPNNNNINSNAIATANATIASSSSSSATVTQASMSASASASGAAATAATTTTATTKNYNSAAVGGAVAVVSPSSGGGGGGRKQSPPPPAAVALAPPQQTGPRSGATSGGGSVAPTGSGSGSGIGVGVGGVTAMSVTATPFVPTFGGSGSGGIKTQLQQQGLPPPPTTTTHTSTIPPVVSQPSPSVSAQSLSQHQYNQQPAQQILPATGSTTLGTGIGTVTGGATTFSGSVASGYSGTLGPAVSMTGQVNTDTSGMMTKRTGTLSTPSVTQKPGNSTAMGSAATAIGRTWVDAPSFTPRPSVPPTISFSVTAEEFVPATKLPAVVSTRPATSLTPPQQSQTPPFTTPKPLPFNRPTSFEQSPKISSPNGGINYMNTEQKQPPAPIITETTPAATPPRGSLTGGVLKNRLQIQQPSPARILLNPNAAAFTPASDKPKSDISTARTAKIPKKELIPERTQSAPLPGPPPPTAFQPELRPLELDKQRYDVSAKPFEVHPTFTMPKVSSPLSLDPSDDEKPQPQAKSIDNQPEAVQDTVNQPTVPQRVEEQITSPLNPPNPPSSVPPIAHTTPEDHETTVPCKEASSTETLKEPPTPSKVKDIPVPKEVCIPTQLEKKEEPICIPEIPPKNSQDIETSSKQEQVVCEEKILPEKDKSPHLNTISIDSSQPNNSALPATQQTQACEASSEPLVSLAAVACSEREHSSEPAIKPGQPIKTLDSEKDALDIEKSKVNVEPPTPNLVNSTPEALPKDHQPNSKKKKKSGKAKPAENITPSVPKPSPRTTPISSPNPTPPASPRQQKGSAPSVKPKTPPTTPRKASSTNDEQPLKKDNTDAPINSTPSIEVKATKQKGKKKAENIEKPQEKPPANVPTKKGGQKTAPTLTVDARMPEGFYGKKKVEAEVTTKQKHHSAQSTAAPQSGASSTTAKTHELPAKQQQESRENSDTSHEEVSAPKATQLSPEHTTKPESGKPEGPHTTQAVVPAEKQTQAPPVKLSPPTPDKPSLKETKDDDWEQKDEEDLQKTAQEFALRPGGKEGPSAKKTTGGRLVYTKEFLTSFISTCRDKPADFNSEYLEDFKSIYSSPMGSFMGQPQYNTRIPLMGNPRRPIFFPPGRMPSRFNLRTPPMVVMHRPAVQPLEKTANGWKPPTNLSADEKVKKVVTSCLNKLSDENFEIISSELTRLQISTQELLNCVISQIFTKAIREPKYAQMYTRLCGKLAAELKVDPNVALELKCEPKKLFRKVLLDNCQKEFTQNRWTTSKRKPREGLSPEELEELEKTEYDARKCYLGNITFIGELYKASLLSDSVMHGCVKSLLTDVTTPQPEDMEALCMLLKTIGQKLDTQQAKSWVDAYMSRMTRITELPSLAPRLRFLLQDVIEMRRNSWIPRSSKGVPKVTPGTPAPMVRGGYVPPPATTLPTHVTPPQSPPPTSTSPPPAQVINTLMPTATSNNQPQNQIRITYINPNLSTKNRPTDIPPPSSSPPSVTPSGTDSTEIKGDFPTRKVEASLEEFSSTYEVQEVIDSINSFKISKSMLWELPVVIIQWVLTSASDPKKILKHISSLLKYLVEDGTLSKEDLKKSLFEFMETKLEDIILESPLWLEVISILIARAMADGLFSYNQMIELLLLLLKQPFNNTQKPYGVSAALAGETIRTLIQFKGISKVRKEHKNSKTDLKQFLPSSVSSANYETWLEQKQLTDLFPAMKFEIAVKGPLSEKQPEAFIDWLESYLEERPDTFEEEVPQWHLIILKLTLGHCYSLSMVSGAAEGNSAANVPLSYSNFIEKFSPYIACFVKPLADDTHEQILFLSSVYTFCSTHSEVPDLLPNLLRYLYDSATISVEAITQWKSDKSTPKQVLPHLANLLTTIAQDTTTTTTTTTTSSSSS